MAPHLHLEPGCLEGSTWLQKGHAAPLAGCQKETYCIYSASKKSVVFYFHVQTAEILLTWVVFASSILSKASPPFWKTTQKKRMVEEWARGTNLEKTTLSKSLPQLQCRHFRPVNTGRLLMVILVFLIKPSRVSFHIISMECLKMWFIERTQRGSVDTREVHTVRTLPTLPDGRTKMLFFQKENVFALQLSLERKKKLFQFKVNQLPSVEPQPPSSSSWRWPGTDLSDQRRGALPVWRQKGDTFFILGLFVLTGSTHVKEAKCYLLRGLDGEKLMLPFCSAHVSERPVICDVSGDEGDLVHHVLVFDHLSYEHKRVFH